ncbi:hypothetical protein DL89DRAFT_217320, partial [Linderina pennispora]
QHADDVCRVFRKLAEAGLTVSGAKTFIGMQQVEVLGYLCTPEGRLPTGDHVAAIRDWLPPKDVQGVRRFIAT